MLNENQIDDLIQPLIDRQREIEETVIMAIVRRIGKIKDLSPADVYKLERLYQTGSDAQKINKRVAELTRESESEIKKIIKTIAQDAYKDAKAFYDYREIPYIPYAENEALQTIVEGVRRVTLADYTNLSNSTAFMLRDPTNPLIIRPTPIALTYQTVIDRAVQSVAMGIESYNTLIPNAIRDLTQRGITVVDYTTDEGKPHRVRLDTVVRRNILDGIRDVQQKTQEYIGEQIGADGVEISVHEFSAPDHEPIQGHQFSNEEYEKLQTGQPFEDVNGVKFGAIERPIGVWNCRHRTFHIILSHSKPIYTLEQLEEIKKRNADGITITDRDGNEVQKTKYWCTQKMRDYELRLRKAKEGEAAAEAANETDLENEYKSKIYRLQNEYKAFCNQRLGGTLSIRVFIYAKSPFHPGI
ncbi:MAG: hypothetical protein J1F01_05635 [Oscillospiraceae bacterium]|nr:hypothetical protein [Oscillospiraceae bacterium]